MASGFIGLTVLVKLHQGQTLKGLVADVVQHDLHLLDVIFLQTGQRIPEYVVNGFQISDLEISPSTPVSTLSHTRIDTRPPTQSEIESPPLHNSTVPSRSSSFPRPPPSLVPSSVPPPVKPGEFTDPAILRFTKSPVVEKPPAIAQHDIPINFPPKTYAQAAESLVVETRTNHAGDRPVHQPPVSATLSAPFTGLSHDPQSVAVSVTTLEPAALVKAQQTESKRSTRKKGRNNDWQQGPKSLELEANGRISPPSSPEMIRIINAKSRASRRQQITNAQQSISEVAVDVPKSSKRRKRRPKSSDQMQSGWATEDATDIQELGDFDFVGNLSQFDKRSVFDQLRTEDTVAYEDRLVSFNRATGMAKLRPSENVLDATKTHRRTSSISSSGDEDHDDEITRSGSATASKALHRGLSQLTLSAPMRKSTSNRTDAKSPVDGLTGGGRLHRDLSRPKIASSLTMSPRVSSTSLERKRRAFLRFVDSDRICSVGTPPALIAAQAIADEDFSMGEDIIAEQAARSIAKIALSAINPGGSRLARNNHNTSPVIVFLVASNKWGSRALAAARLLLDRGVRVIVSCLGFQPYSATDYAPENDWETCFAIQLKRLEAAGEAIYSWADTSAYLKTLDAPPELIVDALIGPHYTVGTIPDPEQCLADMIAWANASKASVLAIDVPSGIHGSTGQVEVYQGEPAEVRARVIACLGAPTTGLLKALEMRSLQGEGGEWKIFVCDIGFNRAWATLRERGGPGAIRPLKFGAEWIAEVRFDGVGAD